MFQSHIKFHANLIVKLIYDSPNIKLQKPERQNLSGFFLLSKYI